jgi:hypothetical protein
MDRAEVAGQIRSSKSRSPAKPRILIVDDEDFIALTVAEMLNEDDELGGCEFRGFHNSLYYMGELGFSTRIA